MAGVYTKTFNFKGNPSLARVVFEACPGIQPDGRFIACVNDHVVGMRCFFTYGSFAWVEDVAVVPEYQRKKIGTKIMMRILEELKNRNIRTIRLDSTRADYNLDKKLGFIEEYKTVTYEIPTSNVDLGSSEEHEVKVLNYVPGFVADMDCKVSRGSKVQELKAWLKRDKNILSERYVYREPCQRLS